GETKMAEKTKTKAQYIVFFKKIYDAIPERNKKKAEELFQRAAELAVIIDDCNKHLEKEGAVSEMCQGNYSIMRENPYSKVQDAKMKTYLLVIDKLDKMLPDAKTDATNKAGEALAAFIAKGK
ncbi:MAG: hypothetical protein KBT03_06045, partial [Bacteroidales bacterium]|nr:hypothetical protein [Candidatus Scybalousia scybalohippi]